MTKQLATFKTYCNSLLLNITNDLSHFAIFAIINLYINLKKPADKYSFLKVMNGVL